MQIRIILKVWNFLEFLGMVKQVTRNYWEFLGILSISKTEKKNVLGISENNLEWYTVAIT